MSWWFSSSSESPAAADSATAAQQAQDDALFQKLLQQERIMQSSALPQSELRSCMTLFDTMMSCFAAGPQLRHVYLHGHTNDCQTKIDDWKYCLSLKGMNSNEKYQAWIERKAKIMARRRMPGGDTVEELWTIRDEPIVQPEYVNATFLPQTEQNTGGDSKSASEGRST